MIQPLRGSHQSRSIIKCVLKHFSEFTGKHLVHILFFFLIIKKETLAQVFSCKFCKIFKNIFFTEHPRATAFVKKQALNQSNGFLLSNSLITFQVSICFINRE